MLHSHRLQCGSKGENDARTPRVWSQREVIDQFDGIENATQPTIVGLVAKL